MKVIFLLSDYAVGDEETRRAYITNNGAESAAGSGHADNGSWKLCLSNACWCASDIWPNLYDLVIGNLWYVVAPSHYCSPKAHDALNKPTLG